ncbi:MAG: helix-turn-helix domain-containing protein [Lachnospiraceae bacterium]
MSINLLIYESAHQEYNNSLIKLCNFLYLFSNHSPNGSNRIELTQDEISDILALNRVGVTNNLGILRNKGIIATHRKWIEVIDCDGLKYYCSQETL